MSFLPSKGRSLHEKKRPVRNGLEMCGVSPCLFLLQMLAREHKKIPQNDQGYQTPFPCNSSQPIMGNGPVRQQVGIFLFVRILSLSLSRNKGYSKPKTSSTSSPSQFNGVVFIENPRATRRDRRLREGSVYSSSGSSALSCLWCSVVYMMMHLEQQPASDSPSLISILPLGPAAPLLPPLPVEYPCISRL